MKHIPPQSWLLILFGCVLLIKPVIDLIQGEPFRFTPLVAIATGMFLGACIHIVLARFKKSRHDQK